MFEHLLFESTLDFFDAHLGMVFGL